MTLLTIWSSIVVSFRMPQSLLFDSYWLNLLWLLFFPVWYWVERHRCRCNQLILADGAVSDRSVYTSLTPVHLPSSSGVGKRYKNTRKWTRFSALGSRWPDRDLLATNWFFFLSQIWFDLIWFFPPNFALKDRWKWKGKSFAVCTEIYLLVFWDDMLIRHDPHFFCFSLSVVFHTKDKNRFSISSSVSKKSKQKEEKYEKKKLILLRLSYGKRKRMY